MAWEGSEDVCAATAASVDAWVATVTASGTATAEEIAGGEAASRARFTPDQGPPVG